MDNGISQVALRNNNPMRVTSQMIRSVAASIQTDDDVSWQKRLEISTGKLKSR